MLCRGMAILLCAMEAVNFSIADPNDPGQLDAVGFDDNFATMPERSR